MLVALLYSQTFRVSHPPGPRAVRLPSKRSKRRRVVVARDLMVGLGPGMAKIGANIHS